MTLTNNFTATLTSAYDETANLATVKASINSQINSRLALADAFYSIDTAIAGGGSDTYDLVGSLVDHLNNAVTFAKVMLLFIRNKSDTAMTIGGAACIPLLNGSTDRITLPALGSMWVHVEAGITVTATSADKIIITGTAGKTYEMIVLGIAPV